MKRKTILGFTVGLALFSTLFIGNTFQSSAMQQINSPQLRNAGFQYLEKGDSSGLEDSAEIGYVLKDNNLEAFSLHDKKEYDKVFAVIIDQAKNTIIDKKSCTKSDAHTPLGEQFWIYNVANFSLPHYTDKVDIHYYKQSSSEPDFTIKSENFLGRAKLYMPNITDFQRGSNTPLTVYDKDWKVTDDFGKSFLSRITPNYYTIESEYVVGDTTSIAKIGKIVLPQGQENLMSEDEKTIPAQAFTKEVNTGYNKMNFNLYIPKEITEFKFVVYDKNISDKKEDILYQYHIKLNRK